ncbi:hypothetical protein HDU96_006699 [Phlyctochytrium bullatum]|nr:hypothetical protein HDU96_006699 [Phlyctochytrium bullatum]
MLKAYSKEKEVMLYRKRKRKKRKTKPAGESGGGPSEDAVVDEIASDQEELENEYSEHVFQLEKIEMVQPPRLSLIMKGIRIRKQEYENLEEKYFSMIAVMFHRIFVKLELKAFFYKDIGGDGENNLGDNEAMDVFDDDALDEALRRQANDDADADNALDGALIEHARSQPSWRTSLFEERASGTEAYDLETAVPKAFSNSAAPRRAERDFTSGRVKSSNVMLHSETGVGEQPPSIIPSAPRKTFNVLDSESDEERSISRTPPLKPSAAIASNHNDGAENPRVATPKMQSKRVRRFNVLDSDPENEE